MDKIKGVNHIKPVALFRLELPVNIPLLLSIGTSLIRFMIDHDVFTSGQFCDRHAIVSEFKRLKAETNLDRVVHKDVLIEKEDELEDALFNYDMILYGSSPQAMMIFYERRAYIVLGSHQTKNYFLFDVCKGGVFVHSNKLLGGLDNYVKRYHDKETPIQVSLITFMEEEPPAAQEEIKKEEIKTEEIKKEEKKKTKRRKTA